MPCDDDPSRQPRVGPARGWWAAFARWRENCAARRVLIEGLTTDPRFARDIGVRPEEIGVERPGDFWRKDRLR